MRRSGRLPDRRSHNHSQIIAFLDQHYPDSVPGSPPREQNYDQNKKGSRVVIRAGAYKRADSALGGKRPDKNGRMVVVDRELDRSYALLSRLFETVPAGISDAHVLACRFVLLRANSAGGYQELERISELGRGKDGDPAAREVARLCRRVIKGVLDELDEMQYWLGWGTDRQEVERQQAAADRRKTAKVLATVEGETGHEAIAAYRDLMLKTGSTVEEAEDLTMEHFDCSRSKVQKADRVRRGVA
jgi:hypothetical protein